MNMLMDSLSEVELEQRSDISRIRRKAYREDDDEEILEERVRSFGHKSWE